MYTTQKLVDRMRPNMCATRKMSVELTHICIVLLLLTILYFGWMDVALYYKLQSEPSHLLLSQNYLEAKLKQKINHSVTAPPSESTTEINLSFDAFNPISLKLLMLGIN